MSKAKFQISRSLEEKIKGFIEQPVDRELEYVESLTSAYILGFNYGSVTNYVGLTTDFKLHHAAMPVVGMVFFREMPDGDLVGEKLQVVSSHIYSKDNLGSHSKVDKNENLYLIYYRDSDTNLVAKKVFDLSAGCFAAEQPKLSILDDAKIYNHSAVVRLSFSMTLNILSTTNENGKLKLLLDKARLEAGIEEAKGKLTNDTKDLTIHLKGSNFSTKTPLENKQSLESLYNSLDTPSDLQSMGDYLPQMTKEDKKKLVDKWRNKVRDQRAPLEFQLEHSELTVSYPPPPSCYTFNLNEEFLHLHVNDSIAKSVKIMLLLLRNKLDLLKVTLLDRVSNQSTPVFIEANEFKSCTFKPSQRGLNDDLNHFVPALYAIPEEAEPDYEQLAEDRLRIHKAYLISLQRPVVRYSQRVTDTSLSNDDGRKGYLCNVHRELIDKSGIKGGRRNIVKGTYVYHHYLQDRIQDSGWGCAYRSLQTIISWFKHQGYICSPDVKVRAPKLANVTDNVKSSSSTLAEAKLPLRWRLWREARVPTHEEIQTTLVEVGDKEVSFIGSQKWIGSQEVCYVLSHLYNLDSRFISVSSGSELPTTARQLGEHFASQQTPVMIGGGVLAHTIIGTDFNEKNGDISYLILDPHYTGGEDLSVVTKKGWCGWKKNAFWDKGAFYNLCLPQCPIEF